MLRFSLATGFLFLLTACKIQSPPGATESDAEALKNRVPKVYSLVLTQDGVLKPTPEADKSVATLGNLRKYNSNRYCALPLGSKVVFQKFEFHPDGFHVIISGIQWSQSTLPKFRTVVDEIKKTIQKFVAPTPATGTVSPIASASPIAGASPSVTPADASNADHVEIPAADPFDKNREVEVKSIHKAAISPVEQRDEKKIEEANAARVQAVKEDLEMISDSKFYSKEEQQLDCKKMASGAVFVGSAPSSVVQLKKEFLKSLEYDEVLGKRIAIKIVNIGDSVRNENGGRIGFCATAVALTLRGLGVVTDGQLDEIYASGDFAANYVKIADKKSYPVLANIHLKQVPPTLMRPIDAPLGSVIVYPQNSCCSAYGYSCTVAGHIEIVTSARNADGTYRKVGYSDHLRELRTELCEKQPMILIPTVTGQSK